MIRSPVIARFTGPAVSIREGRRVVRIIPRVLLTLAVLALGGFVLLVLIGLWDRYEKETAALGFSGIYERYVAWQAGFADDPKAYRAAVEAERARTAGVGETAAIEE